MGKKRAVSTTGRELHVQSLSEQIQDPETYGVRTKPRPAKKNKAQEDEDPEDVDVRPGQSSVILGLAREQQEEEDREAAKQAMGGHDIGMSRPGG